MLAKKEGNMVIPSSFLMLLVIFCGEVLGSEDLLACTLSKPRHSKLSMASHRNQTGHWTTQVNLQHETEKEASEPSNSVDVTVEQETQICNGVETITISATVVIPPSRVAADYEFVPPLGYYKMHTVGQTWKDAVKTCAAEGAHLAIVNSEGEAAVLQNLFYRHAKILNVSNNDNAFVGFHDLYEEGQYTTIFGDPLNSTGFTRWCCPGQPNNAPGGMDADSDCGGIHRNGGMNDLPCNFKLPYFCEQEVW